jgi:hypothetical protein
MRALQNKFYFLIFFLSGTLSVVAQDPPPPPPPPPPPGLAIDENIFILLSIAILFGVYIIYKNNLKRKSSI